MVASYSLILTSRRSLIAIASLVSFNVFSQNIFLTVFASHGCTFTDRINMFLDEQRVKLSIPYWFKDNYKVWGYLHKMRWHACWIVQTVLKSYFIFTYFHRGKGDIFPTKITLHIPIFTFTFQVFTLMRALEFHLALGMDTVYQSMFTDSRMSLSHKEMVTVSIGLVTFVQQNSEQCRTLQTG